MDTIFNHNITDQEFTSLFFKADRKAVEQGYADRTADSINFDLHRLYGLRGDEKKARTYLEKIEDPRIKSTAAALHDLVV